MSNTTSVSLRSSSELASVERSSVVLFDVSDRTQIEITGADRASFLHSFTSNDIKRLKPGQGCETFVTSIKGKVVAHTFVFCTEKSLWLDGTAGQTDTILAHFKKYLLIEDVQLIPHAADRGELYISGPMAAPLLQLDQAMPIASQITREANGESFDVRRVDLLETPGFLLSIPLSQIELIKRSLLALGVAEGTRQDFETLRINSGYPRYGTDITEENLAQEVARTKQCISFNKGCYLGQETVARIDSMGHTNQELRRMRFQTNLVPPAGVTVLDATGETEIGVVTSAANDMLAADRNASQSVIAIGLLKRVALKPGTTVQWKSDNQVIAGQVL